MFENVILFVSGNRELFPLKKHILQSAKTKQQTSDKLLLKPLVVMLHCSMCPKQQNLAFI